MSPYLVALVAVGFGLFAALFMLFLAGQLIRNDLNRAVATRAGLRRPHSRILEDLRPLQDTVVAFIARTQHCPAFLRALAQSTQPLTLSSLLKRVQEPDGGHRRHSPSPEKAWAALFIMAAAGLLRFRQGGFIITEIGREIETRISFMKQKPIIMTAADHAELSCAISASEKFFDGGRGEMRALRNELARAKIVAPDNLPPDVITMNTCAELVDLDTGERMEFTLVFPRDANVEEGRMSVFSPLGTAMLGYHVGDEFEWIIPYGLRRLKVAAVRFQPEAALALAA